MICAVCKKEFNPRRPDQKYCASVECKRAAKKISARRIAAKRKWFATEWAKWKADFAKGLTVSNVKP